MELSSDPEFQGVHNQLLRNPTLNPEQQLLMRPTLYPGPHGMHIVAVTDPASDLADELEQTFRSIFPDVEIGSHDLRRYMQPVSTSNGPVINHSWLIKAGDLPVGVRLFSYIPYANCGHGAFVGLIRQVQDKGIGSWLVQQTRLQLVCDAFDHQRPIPDGYCVEIERLEEAKSIQDLHRRRRRLQFHLQNGAVIVPVSFVEPLLPYWPEYTLLKHVLNHGIEQKPMELLWYPQQAATMLSPDWIRQLVTAIYQAIYCLPKDTPLVKDVLYSIQYLP